MKNIIDEISPSIIAHIEYMTEVELRNSQSKIYYAVKFHIWIPVELMMLKNIYVQTHILLNARRKPKNNSIKFKHPLEITDPANEYVGFKITSAILLWVFCIGISWLILTTDTDDVHKAVLNRMDTVRTQNYINQLETKEQYQRTDSINRSIREQTNKTITIYW